MTAPNIISKTTPDLLKDRIATLKTLFPDLFDGDGKPNPSAIKDLLNGYTTATSEKFTFEWSGKMASKRLAFSPSKATLILDKERSNTPKIQDLDSKNPQVSANFDLLEGIMDPENHIIEGDNLEVLKLLQKSYFHKIKCIYIDPPYNTGKDFVYPDNYTENKQAYWEKSGTTNSEGIKMSTNLESNGRYHSDWLSMMQSRLLLARNLLRDDGVIFVSIDDHEVANLRKLMDEVFGEENFVAEIIFQSNSIKNNAKQISTSHEYCLVYTKNLDIQDNWRIILPNSKKLFNYFQSLPNSLSDDDKSKLIKNFIKIENIEGSLANYSLIDDKGLFRLDNIGGVKNGNIKTEIIHPITKKPCKMSNGGWRFNSDKISELLSSNLIYFGKDENNVPQIKRYLQTDHEAVFNSVIYQDTSQDSKKVSIFFNSQNIFDFPKNVEFIKRLLTLATEKDSIILDFFAGSGTTGQAVMELNAEDGGNRRFILVQLPELTDETSEAYKAGYKKISDITIERVKRAGEKLKKQTPQTVDESSEKLFNQDNSPTNESPTDKLNFLNQTTAFKVHKLTYSAFPENNLTLDPEATDIENLDAVQKHTEIALKQEIFRDNVADLLAEIALKDGFMLNVMTTKLTKFTTN